jgi:type-F conjugative transfer system pilin assembly protein TrbC
MRGLKEDSFKETQKAFADLGKDLESGIEINPEAFETYHIKQVPVFIRVKSTPGKDPQELGRLSGNVSLSFAAKKLKEQP